MGQEWSEGERCSYIASRGGERRTPNGGENGRVSPGMHLPGLQLSLGRCPVMGTALPRQDIVAAALLSLQCYSDRRLVDLIAQEAPPGVPHLSSHREEATHSISVAKHATKAELHGCWVPNPMPEAAGNVGVGLAAPSPLSPKFSRSSRTQPLLPSPSSRKFLHSQLGAGC